MNFVESIRIEGFWGDQTVEVKFATDLNFLIGVNGSGKTTIINLLAASLKADIPTLYAAMFKKIIIVLKPSTGRKKPTIEINKNINEELGSIEISYLIKGKSTDKGTRFVIEGPNEDRFYRAARSIYTRRVIEAGMKLTTVLEGIVKVNWLSIHRGIIDHNSRSTREPEFHSTIDQKIDEIYEKFSAYFSYLTSKVSEESKKFQERVFLSLLEREQSNLKENIAEKDNTAEHNSVIDVLVDLGITPAKAQKSVNSHYTKFEKAQKEYKDNKMTLENIATLYDTHRMRQLVKEWQSFNTKREEIFKPRISFEEIVNSLFSKKKLKFDNRNTPFIELENEDRAKISSLSSGEKQLFILLGETLLQEGRPVVFISDEPELSLHVVWQSVLFENVRKLNPSCQIICATHSPDIVGTFQDRIIQTEGCFVNV